MKYLGREAEPIMDTGDPDLGDAGRMAVIRRSSFKDGIVEVDLTGDTAPDGGPEYRGFVSIFFRVWADGSRFECFYLLPKSGRSKDQLQRNHSAQYISITKYS